MALVESLQKAIEYMESHLLDDITIKDIAEQAHLSPYHDNAGKIPEEIQQLLEEKQQEILDGTLEIPVVDFAQ